MLVVLSPGVVWAPLGDAWAAYSGLSGESHLLNDETVVLLEALSESRVTETCELCRELALQVELPSEVLARTLVNVWDQLIEAGLIRQVQSSATMAR